MGDHLHGAGEWMLSVRWMRMEMDGNLDGSQSVSDGKIIQLSNPHGAMPPRLSVVPQEMEMQMLMLGAMYAPHDRLTLMGMAGFSEKDMRLNTYRGMPDSEGLRPLLGDFDARTSDLHSLSFSALVPLHEYGASRWHVQLGLEKSIGERDARDEILTPMNARRKMILPYAMQSGDGSWRLLSALTGVRRLESWTHGVQFRYRGAIRSKDWNFGDRFLATGWLQKELREDAAISVRLSWRHTDAIEGRDRRIVAPVQTADPANYGGQSAELSIGINQLLRLSPGAHADRLGLELTLPVYQHLNGPQMENDWSVMLSWQKTLGN